MFKGRGEDSPRFTMLHILRSVQMFAAVNGEFKSS
jgi:hypothetical protein